MSSILDALRKLEQEKSSLEQPQGANLRELTFEPEYEIGPSHVRARGAGGTIGYVIAGTVIVAGIVAGAVTVAMMMSDRSTERPIQVAAAAPPSEPASAPANMQTVVTPLGVLDDELPVETAPPSKPVIVAARTVTPTKTEAPKVKEKPKAEMAVEKPEVEKALEPSPLPSLPITQPDPPAEVPAVAPPASGKINFDTLPVLTETDRIRLELPPLQINIVGIPNARNPRASALINMQKVYVGENIPSTQARLLDVDLRGIAIDVRGSRYFVSRR